MSRRVFTRAHVALAITGALAAGVTPAVASAAPVKASAPGAPAAFGPPTDHHRYHEVPFSRAYDSRSARTPLGPGQARVVQIGGRNGIPATGVSGVAVNITAVTPTADTWLTAYRGGTAKPSVSTVNAPKGKTRANFAIVPVSANGTINIANANGSTHYIVDVMGFYSADESYYRATGRLGSTMGSGNPWRWNDTRTNGQKPLAPGETRVMTGADPVGSEPTTSMVLNLTVDRPSGSGYITAWAGGPKPATSSLNFEAGRRTANTTVVKVVTNAQGRKMVTLHNGSSVPVHVAIDWIGDYTLANEVGKRYRPLVTPRRILDTRKSSPITPTTPRTLTWPADVHKPLMSVFVGNVTLIKPTQTTWLSIYPWSYQKNWASSVNADPGEIRSNGVLSYTEFDKFVIANERGSAHVTYDMTGAFEHYRPDEAFRP